jgi:hypothetical protein
VEDFPESIFAAENGIYINMAYKPRETLLLKVAKGKKIG